MREGRKVVVPEGFTVALAAFAELFGTGSGSGEGESEMSSTRRGCRLALFRALGDAWKLDAWKEVDGALSESVDESEATRSSYSAISSSSLSSTRFGLFLRFIEVRSVSSSSAETPPNSSSSDDLDFA